MVNVVVNQLQSTVTFVDADEHDDPGRVPHSAVLERKRYVLRALRPQPSPFVEISDVWP